MAAMIAKDDLLFVTGANVDDDHPHGDIDRIDYGLGRKGEREDIAVLAGVDIVYLLECYMLRSAASTNSGKPGSPYTDVSKFYRKLDEAAIAYIVRVFNALWSNEWICPNNNWEDVYNWEAHGGSWDTAFNVAFSERFWSANSRYSVDLDWDVPGGVFERQLLTTDKLVRLYNGLLYYRVFQRYFWASPDHWKIAVSVENINGGILQDDGGVLEPSTGEYEGESSIFSIEHVEAMWYPAEQKWRGYRISGYANNSTAITIDLKEQFSEEVLKCIAKVKVAYHVRSSVTYYGDFGDGKGSVGTYNAVCSWVTGATWYEPSADGTLTVYPNRDATLMNNASVPGMDHSVWPTGAPTNASTSQSCVVIKRRSLIDNYSDGMVMLCRLKDEYCYSG